MTITAFGEVVHAKEVGSFLSNIGKMLYVELDDKLRYPPSMYISRRAIRLEWQEPLLRYYDMQTRSMCRCIYPNSNTIYRFYALAHRHNNL